MMIIFLQLFQLLNTWNIFIGFFQIFLNNTYIIIYYYLLMIFKFVGH